MTRLYPLPGDLILVEQSGWYALCDGELLRVCERPGWAIEGRDVYVAPRQQVRTFWGPHHGPPSGDKPEYLSTSGGPFKTITLAMVPKPEFVGFTTDEFWHWIDWPRAGGGIEYQRQVAKWKLAHLPDRTWADERGDT
jgi:hypothetical protein